MLAVPVRAREELSSKHKLLIVDAKPSVGEWMELEVKERCADRTDHDTRGINGARSSNGSGSALATFEKGAGSAAGAAWQRQKLTRGTVAAGVPWYPSSHVWWFLRARTA